jgi:hypothetical protein
LLGPDYKTGTRARQIPAEEKLKGFPGARAHPAAERSRAASADRNKYCEKTKSNLK